MRPVGGELQGHHEAVAERHRVAVAGEVAAVDVVAGVAPGGERVAAAAAIDDGDGSLQVGAAGDRDALVDRPPVVLHVAEGDVERPSLRLQGHHCRCQVVADGDRLLGDRVGGAHRVGGIERHRVEVAGGAAVVAGEADEELAPQHGAPRVVVQPAIPVAQHVAGRSDVEGQALDQHHLLIVAGLHHLVAQEIGMQRTIGEPRGLQLLEAEHAVVAA